MKNRINALLTSVGRNTNYLDREQWWDNNKDVLSYLQEKFPFAATIREMIYLEINDMVSRPNCPVCGTELKPKVRIMKGYPSHCSKTCQVTTQQKNISVEEKSIRGKKALDAANKKRIENGIPHIFSKDHFIKTYGEVEGLKKLSESQSRFSKEKCIEKYGEKTGLEIWNARQIKWISTLYDRGHLINWKEWEDDSLTETSFKLYKRTVLKITESQDLHTLEHHEKRGKLDYHLDHKVSIIEGFIRKIPAHIIGSIRNLEFIPYNVNTSKRGKCSMDVSELIAQFPNHSKEISLNPSE